MCLKANYREDSQELYSMAIETRIRNNSHKLQLPNLYLNIGEIILMVRGV